ncbi:hypothetical protein PM082_013408 [Marasmius tenuissimus]|nr:hypothetical protein PM082_013408 [Marasmius tenuissimus]
MSVMNAYIVKNPNPLPAGEFSLKFHSRIAPMGRDGADKYIIPSNADILFIPNKNYDDYRSKEERAVKIGKITALIILTDVLVNNGRGNEFQVICGNHSQELSQLAGEIFDKEGNHKNMALSEGDEGKFGFEIQALRVTLRVTNCAIPERHVMPKMCTNIVCK